MKKQLIIAVTAADIALGQRNDCTLCPIALSLRRCYPGKKIWVDYEVVRIGRRTVDVTGYVEAWMSAFDAGKSVRPTSFCLDAAV